MGIPLRRKRRPGHPGGILKRQYLIPLGLTVTEFATLTGVTRKTVSKITNEGGAVEPYMASRLARVLNTTPQFWLNLQANFDLWETEQDPLLDALAPVVFPPA